MDSKLPDFDASPETLGIRQTGCVDPNKLLNRISPDASSVAEQVPTCFGPRPAQPVGGLETGSATEPQPDSWTGLAQLFGSQRIGPDNRSIPGAPTSTSTYIPGPFGGFFGTREPAPGSFYPPAPYGGLFGIGQPTSIYPQGPSSSLFGPSVPNYISCYPTPSRSDNLFARPRPRSYTPVPTTHEEPSNLALSDLEDGSTFTYDHDASASSDDGQPGARLTAKQIRFVICMRAFLGLSLADVAEAANAAFGAVREGKSRQWETLAAQGVKVAIEKALERKRFFLYANALGHARKTLTEPVGLSDGELREARRWLKKVKKVRKE